MGQSKEYVGQFSAGLSKSAADYAAYMGLSGAQEINDVGRKFAKATLGEVGELKDLGINIDVTSQKFQQLVKDIQATTGASEAQAKQMAIAKDIIKQVEYTAGSASSGMLDGWKQLNILIDNFKQILGQVGGIFSKVFGPVLAAFNSILKIPFVKSVSAWSIALGAVAIAYLSILNLLRKLLKVEQKRVDLEKVSKGKLAAIEAQQKLNKLVAQQLQLTKKIEGLKAERTKWKDKLWQVHNMKTTSKGYGQTEERKSL